jgi:PHD/YefM family antitoxin component YafN of YafNO toxin-antitoxin module
MATGRFVKTKELEDNADALVRDVGSTNETCFITEDGKAKAVLISINRYNALMDIVEDSERPASEPDIRPESREFVSVKGILRTSKTEMMRKNAPV